LNINRKEWLFNSILQRPGSKNENYLLNFEKMKKFIALVYLQTLLLFTIINVATAQNGSTVKDLDGNNYKTIKIGNQTWMAENLRSTKYNDGTVIPLVTDKPSWILLSTPAFCWYNNDTIYKNSYGALYNGYAINTDKLCPSGWHVSTEAEWETLIDFLGGKNIAGGKLKESGTTFWKEPNSGATNESGFTALPGGTRYKNGLFFSIKTNGYWWILSKAGSLNGWYWSMNNSTVGLSKNYYDLTNGSSVRCVRD
jgi:uncharacterized protein (TIGR02145 family)